MNESQFLVLLLILVLLAILIYTQVKSEKKKLIILNSNNQSIEVYAEIANNSVTKAKGLMGRTSLGENEGMLFIFDKPGKYGFWMFNTSIPLDAVYFDENGTVVDILSLKSCGLLNCKNYYPEANFKYVLEVNSGFAKKNRIVIGKSHLKLNEPI